MEIISSSEKDKSFKTSDSILLSEKNNSSETQVFSKNSSLCQSQDAKTLSNDKKPAKINGSDKKSKIQLSDFVYQCSLGKGAYGEVILMKKMNSGTLYAVKMIDKQFLLREKKGYQVQIEREILIKLDSQFITKLNYTFQDQNKLYFVMEYCQGGEFSKFLKRYQDSMNSNVIRFYAAEIVLILEYLHNNGIVHRDLKPENIMLDQNNHLKVIDFGTALFMNNNIVSNEFLKRINKMKQNEYASEEQIIESYQSKHKCTFVGTAEYVSPELLNDEECGYSADIWALGCIIYKMYSNKTPFWDQTEYLVFQNIKQGKYSRPDNMEDQAYDLIQGMLKTQQNDRFTIQQIKEHPYFLNIDWMNLIKQPAPKLTAKSLKIDSSSIVHKGVVLKKCGWIFYKPRLLMINNHKQIMYYDTINNQQKGIINLTKQCYAILKTSKKWRLQIPGRTYYFKFYEQSCQEWVDIVNQIIQQIE